MRRKRRNLTIWLPTVLSLALFAGIALWALRNVRAASESAEREGLRQAELAVRSAAVCHYALEGAYPASYEALKAYGGVAVDEESYQVFYEIFASNIMPEITVVRRKP